MANDTMFTQGSRNEAILHEIINKLNNEAVGELPPPRSRIEVLLQEVLGKIDNVDPEAIADAVYDWLDEHPEATTTVEDGSITKAKLDNDLKDTVDEVSELKSQFVYSTNLLNYKDIEDYGILSQYSDAIVPSDEYMVTPYIKVEPSTEYLKSFSSTVAFYDNEKQWLGGASGESFTTPANTAFVRCTIKAEYVSSGTFKVTIRKSSAPLECAFYKDLRYPNPEIDLFRDIRGTYQITTKSSSYPDGVERVSYLRHYRTLDNVMVREDYFAYTFESGIVTLTTETRTLMKTAQTLVYKYYADGKVEVI